MDPWNKGKTGIYSKETLEKMSQAARLKTGKKNPFFGKKHSKELKARMSGPNNRNWKGNNVGYAALHDWLERRLPKPDRCTNCNMPVLCKECGRTLRLEIANITGQYERELCNWRWLCTKCHRRLDKYERDPVTGRFLKGSTKARRS